VRFARLMHRRVRAFGGPAVRAAFGGNLSLPWLLLRVVPKGSESSGSSQSAGGGLRDGPVIIARSAGATSS
jgi:hypothetical protein